MYFHSTRKTLASESRHGCLTHTQYHPGRYYVDPVCRADETDQEKVPGATSGHVITGRFNLPSGLTCSRCIVQMVYCETTNCSQHCAFLKIKFEIQIVNQKWNLTYIETGLLK